MFLACQPVKNNFGALQGDRQIRPTECESLVKMYVPKGDENRSKSFTFIEKCFEYFGIFEGKISNVKFFQNVIFSKFSKFSIFKKCFEYLEMFEKTKRRIF